MHLKSGYPGENPAPPLDVERKIDESTALQMKEMELKKLHLELELMEAKQGQIITTGNTPTNELTETLKIMKTSLERQSLPRPAEPRVFDGNPLRCRDWKMAFNRLIACKGIPDDEKLFHMQIYISGNALQAIEGSFQR